MAHASRKALTGSQLAASRLTLLSVFALVLILTLVRFSAPFFSPVLWLIQIAPLLAFVPGLTRRRIRAYQWLCFVILLYFIQGVLNMFEPGGLIRGSAVTFFCVLLFSSAVWFVHGRHKGTQSPR